MDLFEPVWQRQEPDDDSGIDTDYSSGMETVTSSNYQFRFEGRRRLEAASIELTLIDTTVETIIPIPFPMMMRNSNGWTNSISL
jgi:hypothetical protein